MTIKRSKLSLTILAIFLTVTLPLFSYAQTVTVTFQKIADNNTPVPGGTDTFCAFSAPALDLENLVFRANTCVFPIQRGIYKAASGMLHVVVDNNTLIPGSETAKFRDFGMPSIDGESVAFIGTDVNTFAPVGIFTYTAGSLNKVVGTDSPIPGGIGTFGPNGITNPSFSDGVIAFHSADPFKPMGVYAHIGGVLTVVADESTSIPGGSGVFTKPSGATTFSDVFTDGGNVIFEGHGTEEQIGIYASIGGLLSVVADRNTAIPNGPGNFGNFNDPVLSGSNVAFVGLGASNFRGVYINNGNGLNNVADTNTTIPEQPFNFNTFDFVSSDGENIAWLSNACPTCGYTGIFAVIDGVLTKIIDSSDTLDNKSISFFEIGHEALSGNRIGFSVRFTDGSQGVYVAEFQQLFEITTSLSAVRLGEPFSEKLETFGGVAPFTWKIVAGALPDNVSLTTDGVLSGTPTQLGESNFTLRATDSVGNTADRMYTLSVDFLLSTDIRIHKTGTTPVPGRVSKYFIFVENISNAVAHNVVITELLEPWFTFVLADPVPASIEHGLDTFPPAELLFDMYDQFLVWEIPRLNPGEAKIITYSAQLDAMFPIGEKVTGLACQRIPRSECDAIYATCLVDPVIPVCTISVPFGGIKICAAASAFCTGSYFSCLVGLGLDCLPDSTAATQPIDPNEKFVSPAEKFIQPDQNLFYPIHFENIGDIEAQDVFITDVLDPNLDISTLQIIHPEDGVFDLATRTLQWNLLGINLPPGESGDVLFSIKPLQGLPSGTEIRNSAKIQFEVFAPLITAEVVNVIDAIRPNCQMAQLPAEILTSDFLISWSSTDSVGEIDYQSVFVSIDGGGFAPFLVATRDTDAMFHGELGKTYEFLCAAKDTAGNLEIQEPIAEAVTTVVGFAFTGFFAPVENRPIMNSVKAGRAVPIKFSLAGDKGLDIFVAGSPNSQKITCDTGATLSDVEETITTGKSNLHYDASDDQYVYVWKTDDAWAGTCRQFTMELKDGSVHKADFVFE